MKSGNGTGWHVMSPLTSLLHPLPVVFILQPLRQAGDSEDMTHLAPWVENMTPYEPTSLQMNHLSPLPCAQLRPHKNTSTDFRAASERDALKRYTDITWKPSIRAHLSSSMEMGDASHCGTTTLLIEKGERWCLRMYLFSVLLICSTA